MKPFYIFQVARIEAPIWGDGRPVVVAEREQATELLASGRVPDSCSAIGTPCYYEPTVVRKCRGADDVGVTDKAPKFAACCNVPQPCRPIPGPSQHGTAVRREDRRGEFFGMPGEAPKFAAGFGVPQPRRIVRTAG